MMITNNLPSGYFRDLQIIKEVFVPAFAELTDCLEMTTMMMAQVEVNTEIMKDSRYDLLFSVEEVNRMTLLGTPFRDAYKQVGLDIEAGNFKPNKTVSHTHEGSIGNLQNDEICAYKNSIVAEFSFEKVHAAETRLLD
jgi:argininosuccinate lyase